MNMKKRIGALAVCMLAFLLTAAPAVWADGSSGGVTGGTVDLAVTLLMDPNAEVPNVVFDYTIAPGEAVAASGGELPIVSGPAGVRFQSGSHITVDAGNPKKASVAFLPGDATTDKGNKKAVQKTLTVDFSGVSFPDTGVYRYVVTEAPIHFGGVENDPNDTRYIDIYVVNDSGTLRLASALVHLPDDTAKSAGYTCECSSNALTVAKLVEGNQASKRKYFKFTVTLDNSTGGTAVDDSTRFVITGSFDRSVSKTVATSYDTAEMNQANADELSVDGEDSYVTYQQLREGKVFYLHHGQNVVINDIPKGCGYTVTEETEDYTLSAFRVTGDQTGFTRSDATARDDTLTAYTTLTYTNSRNAPVPAGVTVAIVVPSLLLLGGVVGIGLILRQRRKRQ